MTGYTNKRAFKRRGVHCILDSLSFPKERQVSFAELKEEFFKEEAQNYYEVAQKIHFDDIEAERNMALSKLVKSKFYSVVFSLYPVIYDKTSFISLSEKAIAFETSKMYQDNMAVYLMLILDGEILPLILSSSIVRIVSKEKTKRYQYVVCFKDLSNENRKKIQAVVG